MIDCNVIYEYYELNNQRKRAEISKQILSEFFNAISFDFDLENADDYLGMLLSVKNNYVLYSEYLRFFYNILSKYNYNKFDDLTWAVKALGTLQDPNKNSKKINQLIRSPYIDDISYNGKNKFTIISPLITFSFYLPKKLFTHIPELMEFMEKDLRKNCHNNAYSLMQLFPNDDTVTSLCKSHFDGTIYYHSYHHDLKYDKIVDLAFMCIMDKDKYYQLFHPQEILRIKQEDFILLYEETLKETSIDEKKCKLLKVALYQQLEYLNQNEDEKNKILNYIGSKNLQGK